MDLLLLQKNSKYDSKESNYFYHFVSLNFNNLTTFRF